MSKKATTLQRALSATALTAISLAPMGGAYAADGEVAIEEILVTATRRSASVQDIPFNLTVMGSKFIEDRHLDNINELARWVPGLTLIDQGPRGSNALQVRGLNVDSLTGSEGLGNDSGGTVAIYIGDIPLYLDLKLLDIDRVEVLIGPQGTLYGAGTLGGAIRYIVNKPDTEAFSANVNGSVYTLSHSSGAGFDGDVTINIPIVEGKFALRGVFGYLDDPGFIDYDFLVREVGVSNPQPDFNDPADVAANLTSKKDVNWERTLSARISALLNVTDSVQATLAYFFQNQDAGGRQLNTRDAFGTGKYVSGNRFVEPNDRDNHLISLEVVADLGFAELTSATGFSFYNEVGQRDQTDLLLNFEYGYEDFPSFASFTREEADEDRFNQEIRLVSTSDSALNWIIGGFYNRFKLDAISEEFTPGIPEFFGVVRPDNLEYIQLTKETLTEKAVFGEIGYQITDQWQVTVGGRYFDYKDDAAVGFDLPLLFTLLGFQGPDEINVVLDENGVSDNGFIFKVNTSFEVNEDFMVYGTVSEGYRIGGVNSVPPCPDPLPPTQNVCALPDEVLISPDTTLNKEIGFRGTWLDRRFTVNAAIYHINWDDIQVSSTTVNGAIPITANGGKAVSKGLELSFNAVVSENMSFHGNYSYTDAKLTTDAPGLVSGEDAFDGDRVAGTPKHMGGFGVNYAQSLANGMDFNANYGVTFTSDIYTRTGLRNHGEILDGFAVQNAAIGVGKDNWKVSIFAENLFDKFAESGLRSSRETLRSVGGFALRAYSKNVIRPRVIGISFSYLFGG